MNEKNIDWSNELNLYGELERLKMLCNGIDLVTEKNKHLREVSEKVIKEYEITISQQKEIIKLLGEKDELVKTRLVQILKRLLAYRLSEAEEDWGFCKTTPKRDKEKITDLAEAHNKYMRDIILEVKHLIDTM